MHVLEFHQVTKDYLNDGEAVRAVDSISLEVREGEFIALAGPSGCGKSTLLNLAGAMDFPTTGLVLLDGVPTSKLNDAGLTRLRRSKAGFIFQSFQLLDTLTALENVELPLLLAGERETRAAALAQLRNVEMETLADRLPHQLSGGQMQRVAIARALVHSPKVLLADEPTGNLDSVTGRRLLELLRQLNQAHSVTILMATHSLEAIAFASRILHMRDGRIEELQPSL
ncbi:MAG TPA: ABC transporter ATP-binding protein [Terriglobia bacterium]|nr:ABC transporter ATP-binding protein [Terriglobia bacterium]